MSPPAATESPDEPTEPTATQATVIYRRTERTALYIQTQEGDTVRLKLKTREAAAATTTTSASPADDETDGQLLTELDLRSVSATKIGFYVEGNLNADELEAISNVIEQAGALADEFFAGDLRGAFAAAQNLDIDGAQLAKVGLRFSVREQATYSRIGLPAAVATPTAPATPTPPPVDETAAPPPSTPGQAPTPPTTPVAATEETTATSPDASTAPTPTDDAATPAPAPTPPAATDHSALAAQVLNAIANFLRDLLDTFGTPAAANTPPPTDTPKAPPPAAGGDGIALDMSIKIRLFQMLLVSVDERTAAPAATGDEKDAAAGTPPGAALPALVGDTLDALAAAQQPRLRSFA